MNNPDVCQNRHKGNPESVEANDNAAPYKAAHRLLIEGLLVLAGPAGLTSEEVEERLGLTHQTASARLSELKIRGCARGGERRMTRSGSWARALVHRDYWNDDNG